jgi:hypothetical protein
MLRKGKPVSDLLVFVGDGTPNSIFDARSIRPKLPDYVNFDCINADALVNRIKVENKMMVLPNGISYYMLNLKNMKEVKLSTLRKLVELAKGGIIITGDKPQKLAGYNHTSADNQEFEKLVKELWSAPNTKINIEWDELYKTYSIPKDLVIEDGEGIMYTHRKTQKEDIYFFYNPKEEAKTFDCTFNVDGKIPEFWNQMNGEITKLAAYEHVKGQTRVAITLPSEGSGFIVFRQSSKGVKSVSPAYACKHPHLRFSLDDNNKIQVESGQNEVLGLEFADSSRNIASIERLPDAVTLSNVWNVEFPNTKSDRKSVVFDTLIDWTIHNDEEIKHYSGTANYETKFNIGTEILAGDVICKLDMGEVNVAARVLVNGIDLGVVWMKPHVLDISKAIKSGENTLSLEVTNQWTNRLIGDEEFPDETGYHTDGSGEMPEWFKNNEPAPIKQRNTFTTYNFYTEDRELIPAGLKGPVRLIFSKIVKEFD